MILTITFDIDEEHRHSARFEIAPADLKDTGRLEELARAFLLDFLHDTKRIHEREEASET